MRSCNYLLTCRVFLYLWPYPRKQRAKGGWAWIRGKSGRHATLMAHADVSSVLASVPWARTKLQHLALGHREDCALPMDLTVFGNKKTSTRVKRFDNTCVENTVHRPSSAFMNPRLGTLDTDIPRLLSLCFIRPLCPWAANNNFHPAATWGYEVSSKWFSSSPTFGRPQRLWRHQPALQD